MRISIPDRLTVTVLFFMALAALYVFTMILEHFIEELLQ
jgi:hypothetical protein